MWTVAGETLKVKSGFTARRSAQTPPIPETLPRPFVQPSDSWCRTGFLCKARKGRGGKSEFVGPKELRTQ